MANDAAASDPDLETAKALCRDWVTAALADADCWAPLPVRRMADALAVARAEGAAAEREACAAWLAHRAKEIRGGDLLPISFDAELDDCAAAIRARRKQP